MDRLFATRQSAAASLCQQNDKEAIAYFDGLIKGEPTDWQHYLARGAAHKRLHHFDKAANDIARARELGREWWATSDRLLEFGLLRIFANDIAGCHDALRELHKQYGPENEDLALLACVAPTVPVGLIESAKMVAAAEQEAKRHRGKPRQILLGFGALLYRTGKLEDSLKPLLDAVEDEFQGETLIYGSPQCRPFPAMAMAQLGRRDEAKEWLTKTQEWLRENQYPSPGRAHPREVLIMTLLEREARTLLASLPPAKPPAATKPAPGKK